MPQLPFAFEFKCEWPNDLCVAELPFSCAEMFVPFLIENFSKKKKNLSVNG